MNKETLNILIQFKKTISSETDRGCALFASLFLEKELEKVLMHKLVGNTNFKKDLFSYRGPLGTFSSKIKLSYSLGIISKDIMRNLDVIRKIQNDFDDDYNLLTFECGTISNRVFDLTELMYPKEEVNARKYFESAAFRVLTFILKEFETEPFKEKECISISEVERKKMINEAEETANEIIEALINKIQNE